LREQSHPAGRAQAEPRHEQQHRIIARAMPGVTAHRGKNGLEPIGRQMPGQSRLSALGRLGNAQCKVARRCPTPEQMLEESPKMGRGCLVSIRMLVCKQMLDEAYGVGGAKTCQLDHPGSEAMIKEPVSKAQQW
jgi:hypothetical protein